MINFHNNHRIVPVKAVMTRKPSATCKKKHSGVHAIYQPQKQLDNFLASNAVSVNTFVANTNINCEIKDNCQSYISHRFLYNFLLIFSPDMVWRIHNTLRTLLGTQFTHIYLQNEIRDLLMFFLSHSLRHIIFQVQ